VQGALSTDKDNQELINLEVELKNLISLTKQLLEAGEAAAPGPSNKKGSAVPAQAAHQTPERRQFTAGEECQAKYAGDGRWYSARIVSVGGSTTDPKYTVIYKGYDSTEIVTSESLRPSRNTNNHSSASTTTTLKRPSVSAVKLTPEEEAEKERKRKRSEKKAERSASKSAEANAMQNTWQKFAKKAEKKGTLKTDKSMFKTPDDPLAKGKCMQCRWTGCID
jgi:survival-of-motor-neuron-related-splicing factor 30